MNVRPLEKSDEMHTDNVRRCSEAFAQALNDAIGAGLFADESRTSRIVVSTSVSRPGAKP